MQLIETTGEGKSVVATPDGKKPKEEEEECCNMDTMLFLFLVEENFAGEKFREIPFAVDIIFAGGKFRAKSKFAKIATIYSTRQIAVKPAFHGACFCRAAFSRSTFCRAC